MNYSELEERLKDLRLSPRKVSIMLEMSQSGFKMAMEKQTLPINKVVQLCNILEIEPNEFFSWGAASDGEGKVGVQNNLGGKNNQYNNINKDIIKILEGQLKEKDKQIERLVELLGKK